MHQLLLQCTLPYTPHAIKSLSNFLIQIPLLLVCKSAGGEGGGRRRRRRRRREEEEEEEEEEEGGGKSHQVNTNREVADVKLKQ